jgi:hypothetical protein
MPLISARIWAKIAQNPCITIGDHVPKKSISDRIVSLSQPHIRPIVRGKAGKPVEFGAKLSVSCCDGYVFLDRISWGSS